MSLFTGERPDLGPITITLDGTTTYAVEVKNTAGASLGALVKAGTSAAPVVSTVANQNFIQVYTSSNKAGVCGFYNHLYLTAAAAGGESFRTFTSVSDVAAGTAHGAHISLSFGTTGSITDLGVASRNTLHIANSAITGGTYAAIQPELYADGSTSDPAAVTELSFIRVVNDGNATGVGKIDDKAFLLTLAGGAIGAGNVMAAKTAAAISHTLRMKGPDGVTYYLMVSNAQ